MGVSPPSLAFNSRLSEYSKTFKLTRRGGPYLLWVGNCLVTGYFPSKLLDYPPTRNSASAKVPSLMTPVLSVFKDSPRRQASPPIEDNRSSSLHYERIYLVHRRAETIQQFYVRTSSRG